MQAQYLREQTELARLEQQWVTPQRQQAAPVQHQQTPVDVPTTPAIPKAEYQGENLWQKLQQGAVLSDAQIKQLFHVADLHQYDRGRPNAPQEADMLREYMIQKLAESAVTQADRDEAGNIVLQGVAVRPEDARYFTEQDFRHFQQTDMHLNPKQISSQSYPYSGNRPGTRPANENAAAYQMLGCSADELQRVGITDDQRIRQVF